MITFRLFRISRSMRGILSRERAEVYTGVIAILVESALPFTLLGIGYLITYIRMDPESLAFADIWGCFVVGPVDSFIQLFLTPPFHQSLSPQAIILRVALGSAWSKKTVTTYGTNTAVNFTDTYRSQPGTALQNLKKETFVSSGNNSAFALSSKRSNSNFDEV